MKWGSTCYRNRYRECCAESKNSQGSRGKKVYRGNKIKRLPS